MESHSFLDLVIVMPGLNDLMKLVGRSVDESAWGLLSLSRTILSHIFSGVLHRILIIVSPAIGKLSAFNKMVYEGKEEESKKLAECYRTIEEVTKSEFLNSNKYLKVSDINGINPLPDQYEIFGKTVANKVRAINLRI